MTLFLKPIPTESGEGRHNDPADGDYDGRLELRGLIENNRDHARRRRRTNEEAKTVAPNGA